MKKSKQILSKSMQFLFEAEQELARIRKAHPERECGLLKHPVPMYRTTKNGKRICWGYAMTKPIVARMNADPAHFTGKAMIEKAMAKMNKRFTTQIAAENKRRDPESEAIVLLPYARRELATILHNLCLRLVREGHYQGFSHLQKLQRFLLSPRQIGVDVLKNARQWDYSLPCVSRCLLRQVPQHPLLSDIRALYLCNTLPPIYAQTPALRDIVRRARSAPISLKSPRPRSKGKTPSFS